MRLQRSRLFHGCCTAGIPRLAQHRRLVSLAAERRGDFSGTQFVFRRRSGCHRILQRKDLAHRFAGRQYRAEAIRTGAAAHGEPERPAREAPPGSLCGHSAVAGPRGHLDRGQTLLFAFRLRSAAHPESRLCRCQGRAQGAGRLHADHATGARLLARSATRTGGANWRSC